MSHKIVKVDCEKFHYSHISKLFDDLEQEGYKFLTWASPWFHDGVNYSHSRLAVFHKPKAPERELEERLRG
jgi:hypothetical protein